jgi:hypothetical protein
MHGATLPETMQESDTNASVASNNGPRIVMNR